MQMIADPTFLLNDMPLSAELRSIAQKVVEGIRITPDEGIYLYEHGSLGFLGTLANYVREKERPLRLF